MEILTDKELLRYSRQISLKGMDIEGQEKLKQANVLILGVGGLGCTVAQYLTVSGIGSITLADFDLVELSNLQRQILHHDNDIGLPKVISAKNKLNTLNPNCAITTIDKMLNPGDLDELCSKFDLVLDCTDNLIIRDQLNHSCFNHKISLISAAAIRMEGVITTFTYLPKTPCYKCFSTLFGDFQLTCAEAGVLAPLVGLIGCIQATEAIKLLTNLGTPLVGQLLFVDALSMEFRKIKLNPQLNCPVCSS